MKVLVAGATGQTGIRLINELASRGHHPIALVRSGSDTSALASSVETRRGDLTDLAADVCEGCDAVIFAAGAGGSSDPEMTDKVDRDGAKRLIDLAAKAKVDRFVMLSSIGADDPDPESELAHYLQAKHDADEHLKASGIPYFILRPVSLTAKDGERRIRLGEDVDPKADAARGDVAALLADAVDGSQWLGKSLHMQSL
jgi:uncharacterized protein YbjT (DUF2867 family)